MIHKISIPSPNSIPHIRRGVLKFLEEISNRMNYSSGLTKYTFSNEDYHPELIRQVAVAMSLSGWHLEVTEYSIVITANRLTSSFDM